MSKQDKPNKSVHLIGVHGTAMSGLAVILAELGYKVSGSDSENAYQTEANDKQFERLGIVTYKGFNPENIKQTKPDVVVVSAAYGADHPEVKTARRLRRQILTQSEMLGKVIADYEVIAVSGVHGKTTTSSLIAYVLKTAGYSPGWAIGAPDITDLAAKSHIGDGKYFVVEADEFRKSQDDPQPKFFDLPIRHLVVTSIELDHPDLFSTAEDVYDNFYRLSSRLPRNGSLIACVDWPLVARLVKRQVDRQAFSYGFSQEADFRIVNFRENPNETTFEITVQDKKLGPFRLNLPGRYGAQNAAAAVIVALNLGIKEAVIVKSLSQFKGPKRRFELLGRLNGALFVDDYAHHPSAISGLIEAARHRFPGKRLIAVFQPHTYSRTGRFVSEFAASLAEADQVVLLNIFASAREKSGYVTIEDLLTRLRNLKDEVEYRASKEEAATFLANTVGENDVVLLIGAGDVFEIYQLIAQNLSS